MGTIVSILRQGSKGEEVIVLQQALITLGYLRGSADGDFGPGTLAAVKKFQADQGLGADGVVGAFTVKTLNTSLARLEPAPAPKFKLGTSLLSRCLALTASIETSLGAPECYAKVAGNFDQQGVSFGALQWNFGQKTLQPILLAVYRDNPTAMAGIYGADSATFSKLLAGPHEALMAYFVNLQSSGDPSAWGRWKNRFYKTGLLSECIQAQERAAKKYYDQGLRYCAEYGLSSERAVALMFDIGVQNGSISSTTKKKILGRFPGAQTEDDKLVIIAECRAEASNPQFAEDVKTRKVAIARGAGRIHGKQYDLEREFGIGLGAAADLSGSSRSAA